MPPASAVPPTNGLETDTPTNVEDLPNRKDQPRIPFDKKKPPTPTKKDRRTYAVAHKTIVLIRSNILPSTTD